MYILLYYWYWLIMNVVLDFELIEVLKGYCIFIDFGL